MEGPRLVSPEGRGGKTGCEARTVAMKQQVLKEKMMCSIRTERRGDGE